MARNKGMFKSGNIPWNKGKRHHFKDGHPILGKVGKLSPAWKGGLPNCVDCGKKLNRKYSYSFIKGKLIKEKRLRCRSCSYIFIKSKTPRISVKCKWCNTIIITREKRNRLFCSKTCLWAWQSQFKTDRSFNWKGGYHKPNYGKEFTSYLRILIRDRDSHKCQLCGCPEIETIRKLDVHHIDYNPFNNSMENLISLCLLCHIKTNRNREYWKVYFNNNILQLYKEKI